MKTRALLLVLPLLAAACRDNRASVQIQAICAPTDDCTFGEKCDAQYIGFATIDATRTGHLWLVVQVENQLPDNANVGAGRLNTNDAHLDEVQVEYEGASLPRAVYQLPNFHVPAGGTSVISVEAIPAALGVQTALAAYAPTTTTRDLLAKIRFRGYLDDGSRFETGEFPVGVRVCSGCVTTASGLCAAGQFTCPPDSNGQLPVTCM